MVLTQQAIAWTIEWPMLTAGLQIVSLAYLVYAFQRIARNQAALADYLREKLDRDED